MENNNCIDASAKIHSNVKFGKFNKIGKGVIIDYVGSNPNYIINIGDNNIINDNTRIIVGGQFSVGDWNVFHNDMLLMADDFISIGHNCWFGQNTILDGAGGLKIGNGVRVGMYSQIWTHVASGEQIEGCILFGKRKTKINDNVWLVGSCIVGSGLDLGERSIILINSVVTKNTLPNKTYSGSPAKLMEKLSFYKEITLIAKFEMLLGWLKEYVEGNKNLAISVINKEKIILRNNQFDEEVIFLKEENLLENNNAFYLDTKRFCKTNSKLEREVYKYLYNNKARFTPF